jgi:hypothetical protein
VSYRDQLVVEKLAHISQQGNIFWRHFLVKIVMLCLTINVHRMKLLLVPLVKLCHSLQRWNKSCR